MIDMSDWSNSFGTREEKADDRRDGVTAPTSMEPRWAQTLPRRLGAVAVDTTGPSAEDRIVAIGLIVLDTRALLMRDFDLRYCHMVCDPGRKSTPAAEKKHRFSDWDLRHQEPFADGASDVSGLLGSADLLVAHEATDTRSFIEREYRAIGREGIDRPMVSLEEACRSRVPAADDLNAIAAHAGLMRSRTRPGPLEDAWIVLLSYLWLHDCPLRFPFGDFVPSAPTNWLPVPAKPHGRLPRRKKIADLIDWAA